METLTDLEAERLGAMLRRMRDPRTDESRLGRRWAMQLLELAGEGAGREAIEAAAERRFSKMVPGKRAALVELALELQAAPPPSEERHLDPATVTVSPLRSEPRKEAAMAKKLSPEHRERVRQVVREALATNPDPDVGGILAQLAAEGIETTRNNLIEGYLKPARRELGIEGPTKRPEPKARAAKPAAGPQPRKQSAKTSAPTPASPVAPAPVLPTPAPVLPPGFHVVAQEDGTCVVHIEFRLPAARAFRAAAAFAAAMAEEEAA
jgi:hypothetical protein